MRGWVTFVVCELIKMRLNNFVKVLDIVTYKLIAKGVYNSFRPVKIDHTRMHSSRMRTARSLTVRVATAQGKQGIWLLLFTDRENTGNFVLTRKKLLTQGKYLDCDG